MRLFRLKKFSNSSKCLFSIVKLKSPINKILSYFIAKYICSLRQITDKIDNLVVCNNLQIVIWNSEH